MSSKFKAGDRVRLNASGVDKTGAWAVLDEGDLGTVFQAEGDDVDVVIDGKSPFDALVAQAGPEVASLLIGLTGTTNTEVWPFKASEVDPA